MKAVVKFAKEDGNTEIREVPKPSIEPGEVLVLTKYIGICGSKRSAYLT